MLGSYKVAKFIQVKVVSGWQVKQKTQVVGKLVAGKEGLITESEEEQKEEINNRLKRGDLWGE